VAYAVTLYVRHLVLDPRERVLEISYQPLSTRREGLKDSRVFEMAQRQVCEARTTCRRPACECSTEVSPAIVLDPVAGTGTTLQVAKQHGRHAIGIELNAEYIGLIERRLLHQTRHQAAHEEAA
jgi:DNA methylase